MKSRKQDNTDVFCLNGAGKGTCKMPNSTAEFDLSSVIQGGLDAW
jgi:hypothetical protein